MAHALKDAVLDLLSLIEQLEAQNAALKGIIGSFKDVDREAPVDWRSLLQQTLAGRHIEDIVRERYAPLVRQVRLATDDAGVIAALVSQFQQGELQAGDLQSPPPKGWKDRL